MEKKTEKYKALLLEIGDMVRESGKTPVTETTIAEEITATMRELRQFIERLRRVKDGEASA